MYQDPNFSGIACFQVQDLRFVVCGEDLGFAVWVLVFRV